MKRFYRFVALFTSLFLVLSANAFAYDPVGGMVYTDTQNINTGAINNAINTLPSGIKTLLEREGVKIYYNGQRGSVMGYSVSPTVTYYTGSNKVASVDKKVEIYLYSNADISNTLPHECGHALDMIAGYVTGKYIGERGISNTNEWNTLYNNNYAGLSSIDGRIQYIVSKGADEAFAESFRLYCTNPNGLKSACPDVYNFIAAQVAKYSPAPKALTKSNFDYKAYADTYPDLKAAFGYDKEALWNHYNNFGKAEGRTALPKN